MRMKLFFWKWSLVSYPWFPRSWWIRQTQAILPPSQTVPCSEGCCHTDDRAVADKILSEVPVSRMSGLFIQSCHLKAGKVKNRRTDEQERSIEQEAPDPGLPPSAIAAGSVLVISSSLSLFLESSHHPASISYRQKKQAIKNFFKEQQ